MKHQRIGLFLSGLLLWTSTLLSCSPNYLQAVSLRKNGEPLRSMVLLDEDYSRKQNPAVLKQLYISIEDAAMELTISYNSLLRVDRIDIVTGKLRSHNNDCDLVKQTFTLTDDPFESKATTEAREYAEAEGRRLFLARNKAVEHLFKLRKDFEQVVGQGNEAIALLDENKLFSHLSSFEVYMSADHPIHKAWSAGLVVLKHPSKASSNAELLYNIIRKYGNDLPSDLISGLTDMLEGVRDRIDTAEQHAADAKKLEEKASYARALEYITRASDLNVDAHGAQRGYFARLLEGANLRQNEEWIEAVRVLLNAQQLVKGTPGADKELTRATRDGIGHFESTARATQNSLTERLTAVRSLDIVTSLTGAETRARSIEQSIVNELPKPKIRYDIARTRNDVGSKLYRIVQQVAETQAREYGATTTQVDILDEMASYNGQNGRATGSGELFLVEVDVVDLNSSVERDRDTLSTDYVASYRTVTQRNYKYDEWETAWNRDCNGKTFSDDWAGKLAAGLCIGLAASKPPVTIQVQEPVMDTCRYQVTNHNLYGHAEVRVEMFHVPDGALYMDETFTRDVNQIETEVEQLQGDCRAAGIQLRSIKKSPNAHDVEYPMLEAIEKDISATFKQALRPTNVVRWLEDEFPDVESYRDYRLGAIYAEGGLKAIYKELGVR